MTTFIIIMAIILGLLLRMIWVCKYLEKKGIDYLFDYNLSIIRKYPPEGIYWSFGLVMYLSVLFWNSYKKNIDNYVAITLNK